MQRIMWMLFKDSAMNRKNTLTSIETCIYLACFGFHCEKKCRNVSEKNNVLCLKSSFGDNKTVIISLHM